MGNKRHSVLDWISDFAPLAFLFLEGDEMKREKERERRGLGFMQQQQSLSPTCEWCSFNDALR